MNHRFFSAVFSGCPARFVTIALCILALAVLPGRVARAEPASPIPGLIDLSKVHFEIVKSMFVNKLEGINASYTENQPEKFRGLVLTVRIAKPAGEALTIHGPDLDLHYNHGETYDVLNCQGLSGFSKSMDVDRPMRLWSTGIGSVTTGTSTLDADTLYMDVFYQYLESDTKDVYLMIAQPTGLHTTTSGWKSEEK
jgi:hypothetical protein